MTDIAKRSPQPKYQQLRQAILGRIGTGLQPNSPIPSEAELQDQYRMSRMTVRKAVDQLVAEGRLYRVAGVGTFVAEATTSVELHLSSFTEDMEALGLRPTQRTCRIERVAADAQLAGELDISIGEGVVLLERVRLADDRPVCFERSYLPERHVPGLIESWSNQSLFAALDQRYGLRPTWSRQLIGAEQASARTAELLCVPPGSALLRVRQATFKDDVLIESCLSLYRPDSYELAVVLNEDGLAMRRKIHNESARP